MPLPVQAQQCGLLLRAGEGEPKFRFVAVIRARWASRRHVSQDSRDIRFLQPRAVDSTQTRRALSGRELHGADAIATDGFEKLECGDRVRPESIAQTPSNGFAIRQQVVEEILDARSFDAARGRDRQR